MISGEIGLEIECEGNSFRKGSLPKPWRYVEDHSLRGDDNAEYVFDGPQKFSDVPDSLTDLWSMFENDGTVLDDSNRTSVHVHMNAQSWHLNRLATFCALFFSVEDVLAEWCGDHRVGNLFCLRASDAPAIVWELKKFLKAEGYYSINDHYHYGGLNLHALMKYGSIEVRTMRGAPDPTLIQRWVNILEHMYHLSGEIKDPRDVPGMFSANGPDSYIRKVIGPEYSAIRGDIAMSDYEIREKTYKSIRLAQDICYCLDWDKYAPADESKDPFRRTPINKYWSDDISPYEVSPYPPTSTANTLLQTQTLSWTPTVLTEEEYIAAINQLTSIASANQSSPVPTVEQVSEGPLDDLEWEATPPY
jgi:hypothetical protein